MSNIITVNINGSPYSCKSQMTLHDLVIYLNFNLDLVAVEYNQQMISNGYWRNIQLKNEDKIEIVTIVGGG